MTALAAPPIRVIDFARAAIAWTTHDESRGIWRVVAAARREGDDPTNGCFLAPAVMAGDVYGAGRLPLMPPYAFQLAASRERHVIFREPAAASVADSDEPNARTFRHVAIDVPEIEAEAVPLEPVALSGRWPLTARIAASGQDGMRWTLEFPVGHINLRGRPAAWQVEAGPVIVPAGLIDIPGAARLGPPPTRLRLRQSPRPGGLLAFGPLSAANPRGFRHFARLEPAGVQLFATGAI